MDEYAVRLFQSLHKSYPRFCRDLEALLKETLKSTHSYRFVYMWSAYLYTMSKIGQIMFTNYLCSDPEEDEIEEAWDTLMLDGYADILTWIFEGAEFLLLRVKPQGYKRALSELQTVKTSYNSLLETYKTKRKKIKDRNEKGECIYRCQEIFDEALDILMEVREQEQRRANERDFFLIVDQYHHPRLYKIRSFLQKSFSERKNAKIRKNCARIDRLISKI